MDFPDDFENIYNITQPSVFKYVYYKVNDINDANDIVQEAYMKAINNIENVRDRRLYLPYLKRIAKNIIIGFLEAAMIDLWK